MGPLQIIVLTNLFVLIALSLRAHFKGENMKKIFFFFTAVFGEFLLIDEIIPYLGENNFIVTIVYLSISVSICGYTLVIQSIRQPKIQMNPKIVTKVPNEPISDFPDEQVQKAHHILNEE